MAYGTSSGLFRQAGVRYPARLPCFFIAAMISLACCESRRPSAAATRAIGPLAPPAVNDTSYAGFYAVRSPDDRERLVRLISQMPLGTNIADVTDILGPPDSEGAGDGLLFAPMHRNRGLIYFVAKFRDGLSTSGKDQVLDLLFDWRGRLEVIISDHVPGVESRESPESR